MEEDWGLFSSDLESEMKKILGSKSDSWELVIEDLKSKDKGSLKPEVYKEVLEELEKMLSVGPLKEEGNLYLGFEYDLNFLLLELSTYGYEKAKALRYVNKVIGLEPFRVDLYLIKSSILEMEKDFEGAHQVLETAWSLEPQNYEVNLSIVENLAEMRKYGEAADFIIDSRLEKSEKLKLLDVLDRLRDG